MNNTYKITVESPLVRPGLKLETECSEKYVVAVVTKAMELIREINAPKAEPSADTADNRRGAVAYAALAKEASK